MHYNSLLLLLKKKKHVRRKKKFNKNTKFYDYSFNKKTKNDNNGLLKKFKFDGKHTKFKTIVLKPKKCLPLVNKNFGYLKQSVYNKKTSKIVKVGKALDNISFKTNRVIEKNLHKKNLLIQRRAIKKIKFFKSDVFFFIKKLFNSFVKKGKKYLAINYFLRVFFFVCLKTFKNGGKRYKKKLVFLYFYRIFKNIMPMVIYTNLMFRGENKILPWIIKNKKINRAKLLKICVSWTKKSINKRKEKTLFFRIISEFEEIRKNKGESIKSKNDYYSDFYKNKMYAKFLRKRSWA